MATRQYTATAVKEGGPALITFCTEEGCDIHVPTSVAGSVLAEIEDAGYAIVIVETPDGDE